MIKGYESDSATWEEKANILVTASKDMDACTVQKVYLITYR